MHATGKIFLKYYHCFFLPSQPGLLIASRRIGIFCTSMHTTQVSYSFWFTTEHAEAQSHALVLKKQALWKGKVGLLNNENFL